MRSILCTYLCSFSKTAVHPAQSSHDVAFEIHSDNIASGSLRASSKASQPDFQRTLSLHLLVFAAVLLFGGIPAMWIVTSIDNSSTLCFIKAGIVTLLLLAACSMLLYSYHLLQKSLTSPIPLNLLQSKQIAAYLLICIAVSLNQIFESAIHDSDGVFIPNRGIITLCLLPYWYTLLCTDSRPMFSCLLVVLTCSSLIISGSFLSSKGFVQVVVSAVIYVVMSVSVLGCYFLQRPSQILLRQSSALKTHQNSDAEIVQEENVKKLQDDLEEMRYILMNVAHDLKTPLSATMSGGEFLASGLSTLLQSSVVKRHGQLVDQLSGFSCTQRHISHANSIMLSVIHRVDDYSKLSRGQELTPCLETVDLHAAVSDPVDCLVELQKSVPVILQRIPANISRYIITDKQWLGENLLCLVSNAVKYSDGGEVHVQVSLTGDTGSCLPGLAESDSSQSDHTAKYLRIEVRDSGVITDEVLTRMFKPNALLTRSSGGTGLGLYCLAKRVEALQGQFGVHRVSGGSIFWFQLPYREDPEAPAPLPEPKIFSNKFSSTVEDVYLANSTSTRVDDGRSLFLVPDSVLSDEEVDQDDLRVEDVLSKSTNLVQPLNVLIVDDSIPILRMSSMLMRNQGHEVSTAKHGAEALQIVLDSAANNKSFDVVLMDLQMPIMDGCEAARRIRAWEQSKSLPEGESGVVDEKLIIIGNTAFDHEDAIAAAVAAGMDCVLTKPLKIDRFYKAIQSVKDSRQKT